MSLPTIDPVAKLQSLQNRIARAERDASVLDGRRISLREQYQKLVAEAKEAFGVDTVEALQEKLEQLETEAAQTVSELEQALQAYEALKT